MKDYKEITESVFRKSGERLAEKKQRAAIIRRTVFAVSGMCAAFIIAFGVLTNDSIKNGKKNDFNSSNLITESTQTSAADLSGNVSVTTTAAQPADKTYTEISASTTAAVSASESMSTTSNTEASTAQTTGTAQSGHQAASGTQTTSVNVTQEANRSTTAPQITTTSPQSVVTSTSRNTTTAMAVETTIPDEAIVPATTIPDEAIVPATTIPEDIEVPATTTTTLVSITVTTTITYSDKNELSPLPIPWNEKTLCQKFKSFVIEEVHESVETTTVRRVYTSDDSVVAPEDIDGFITSVEFTGTEITEDGTQIKHKINGNIYTVKSFSKYAVLAVQFEGDSVYYYYSNREYKPKVRGETLTRFFQHCYE